MEVITKDRVRGTVSDSMLEHLPCTSREDYLKKIELSGSAKGIFTLVDDEDYEALSRFRWYLGKGHVYRCSWEYGKSYNRWIHREVLGRTGPSSDGLEVDHRNLNPLDNRKTNLRLVTRAQNTHNSRPRSGIQSGYKGVSWDRRPARWRMRLRGAGQRFDGGSFQSAYYAALAYNVAAILTYGEYGYLNVLRSTS